MTAKTDVLDYLVRRPQTWVSLDDLSLIGGPKTLGHIAKLQAAHYQIIERREGRKVAFMLTSPKPLVPPKAIKCCSRCAQEVGKKHLHSCPMLAGGVMRTVAEHEAGALRW